MRAYSDTIFVRVKASLSVMILVRNSRPFDRAFEGRLVRNVTTRMSRGIA